MPIEKLRRHESPAELIKAGGRAVYSEIHKLII
jgi:hypothetical protein